MITAQRPLQYMFNGVFILWRSTTRMCANGFSCSVSIYMFIVPSSAEPADGWSYYIFVSVFHPLLRDNKPTFPATNCAVTILFLVTYMLSGLLSLEPIIPCWFYKCMCGDPFTMGDTQYESCVLLEDENDCSLA